MDEFYIDPVLYRGRPADGSGRLDKEMRVYDLLDRHGLERARIDAARAAQAAEKEN